MPFASLAIPSIGLSLLRTALQQDGHQVDLHYLNLAFADHTGLDCYNRVADSPTTSMAGDWAFSRAVFGPVPYPSYDDYFEQLNRYPFAGALTPSLRLLFESSRGCWWGSRSHCTFCGLNGTTLAFRSKSAGRALAELRHLYDRYQGYTRAVSAVDNIIDMQYFRDFLPELKALGLDLTMFYETKANLTREQVQALAEAGMSDVQPGIESLSTPVLGLMRKGVSALQNVQLLKWCREYGVKVQWNHLYGLPGEDPEEYRRIVQELLPAISHFDPPRGCFPVRLDRFSPYFDDSETYGIADGRRVQPYVAGLRKAIGEWKELDGSELFSVPLGDKRVIFDLRPAARRPMYALTGPQRLVYEYCDAIRSQDSVLTYLAAQGYELTPVELTAVVQPLLESLLMIGERDRLLSLAIPLGTYSPGVAGARRFLEFLNEQREAAGQESDPDVALPLTPIPAPTSPTECDKHGRQEEAAADHRPVRVERKRRSCGQRSADRSTDQSNPRRRGRSPGSDTEDYSLRS
jgi:hypothetical protein